jgi:GNAT superfamily N-acetyltransferase
MHSTLTTRPMARTDDDLARLKRCFDNNGSPRPLSAFQWQYFDNPVGKLIVDFSIDEAQAPDRVAAVYAVAPVRVRVFGRLGVAAQSLDTITDSAYRGRGLFVSLAEGVYRRCDREGLAFVYGFPNGSSVHGFYTRLGWTSLDPVPFLVRPLRVGYPLNRLGLARVGAALSAVPVPLTPPRLRTHQEIRVIDGFDEEVTGLWKRFSRLVNVAVERDATYLNWRYVKKPGDRYLKLALLERGQLVALAILTVKEKHGGRIGYLMELLHEPGEPDAGLQVARAALSEMGREGADLALAWCLPHAPNRSCYRRAGFLPLPTALRPIELHVGVKPLGDGYGAALGNRVNWYLSYSDSDTV